MPLSPCRALAITACAFAVHAWLMPQPVQWCLGQRIREQAERCVGADVTQRFLVSAEGQDALVAPEVSYRASSPLVRLLQDDAAASDVTPTGRLRVVSLPPLKHAVHILPRRARTTVGALWEGAAELSAQPLPELHYRPSTDSVRWLGFAEVQREEGYPLAATLAAPFDYLLDPLLSTLSFPTAVGAGLLFIAVALGETYF